MGKRLDILENFNYFDFIFMIEFNLLITDNEALDYLKIIFSNEYF